VAAPGVSTKTDIKQCSNQQLKPEFFDHKIADLKPLARHTEFSFKQAVPTYLPWFGLVHPSRMAKKRDRDRALEILMSR
jgi:hypothetical protein